MSHIATKKWEYMAGEGKVLSGCIARMLNNTRRMICKASATQPTIIIHVLRPGSFGTKDCLMYLVQVASHECDRLCNLPMDGQE